MKLDPIFARKKSYFMTFAQKMHPKEIIAQKPIFCGKNAVPQQVCGTRTIKQNVFSRIFFYRPLYNEYIGKL